MTILEAIEECRHRWRDRAAVCNDVNGKMLRAVGELHEGTFLIRDRGASWEDALHEADRGFDPRL
jgi:hypothetical protein